MQRPVNPLEGKTTDRRAVCGRTARTVRREGRPGNRPFLPLSDLRPYRGYVILVFIPFQGFALRY